MLEEFVKEFPLLSITVFSFIITLASTLAYKKFTDQSKMKELREQQKALQEKSKQFRNSPDKMLELQQEMMKLSTEQMRASFKIMFITLIPFILIFNYLRNLYVDAGIGNIVYWKVNIPLVGDGAGWLLSYLIISLVSSMFLRKILKVY